MFDVKRLIYLHGSESDSNSGKARQFREWFPGMLGMDSTAFFWIVYVIGGILGLILVSPLFDWALITLSSLAGASLVVQSLFPESTDRWPDLYCAIYHRHADSRFRPAL